MSYEPKPEGSGALDSQHAITPTPTASIVADDDAMANPSEMEYLQGLPLWSVSIAIAVLLFLTAIELSIVTTTLVSITDDLGGLDNASWVASSYLLGYVGVVIILAKLSDIFGRKPILLASALVFAIFSGACAASTTLVDLIVFRAFQGVGGGGCLALSLIVVIELVPPEKYAKFVAQLNIAVALALILGPLLGGLISSYTTWKWIFFINLPPSVIAIALIFFALPWNFPFQGTRGSNTRQKSPKTPLKRVDFLGCFLLLAATVLLTAGLQEAGNQFPWKSAFVITVLSASALLWGALILWERRVTLKDDVREPVLPWRFLTDRVIAGILLEFVLLGGSLTVTVFQLPQRFQLLNGLSGLDAGVRLIPFGAAFPVGCVVGARVASKWRVAPVMIVPVGTTLQALGFALLGTLSTEPRLHPRTYGFEILAGFGVGMNYQSLYLMIPFVTTKRDNAVALATVSQFRMIGGAVFLAAATAIFNGHVMSQLSEIGIQGLETQYNLTGYMHDASSEMKEALQSVLADAYNYQMLLLAASAGAQMLSTLLLLKRPQKMIPQESPDPHL
ncbi:putative efflux pump antibiotic resistance protein [Nemania sp. FL0916]|nr:putative efflux pump antibiotic resistance protein [Nemania sp. FL0916]